MNIMLTMQNEGAVDFKRFNKNEREQSQTRTGAHYNEVILKETKYDLWALQRKKFKKKRSYYGSGWVGPGLTLNFVFWIIVPKYPQTSTDILE